MGGNMKKHETGITAVVLMCLAAFSTAVAVSGSQDAKKTEEKKTGKLTTVHIKVSAEGVNPLPNESSIQLKGLDDCDQLSRRGILDSDGEFTFSGLPVCKVMLKILITGFETKTLPEVDLADHKNSRMRIQIKST